MYKCDRGNDNQTSSAPAASLAADEPKPLWERVPSQIMCRAIKLTKSEAAEPRIHRLMGENGEERSEERGVEAHLTRLDGNGEGEALHDRHQVVGPLVDVGGADRVVVGGRRGAEARLGHRLVLLLHLTAEQQTLENKPKNSNQIIYTQEFEAHVHACVRPKEAESAGKGWAEQHSRKEPLVLGVSRDPHGPLALVVHLGAQLPDKRHELDHLGALGGVLVEHQHHELLRGGEGSERE